MKTIVVFLILTLTVNACGKKLEKEQHNMSIVELNSERQPIINMDLQEYWRIIDQSAKVSGGSEDEQMEILQEQLEQCSPEDILEFMRIQAKLMDEANHYNAMYAYAILDGMEFCDAATDKFHISEDGFLCFRIWLIHQGKEMFTETLKNPDYLADKINLSDEIWYERIAAVGMLSYMEKTGSYELPNSYRQSAFSDEKIKGTPCPVKDLPGKFPKLWSKFMQ